MTTLLENLYSQGKRDSVDTSACKETEPFIPNLKIRRTILKANFLRTLLNLQRRNEMTLF